MGKTLKVSGGKRTHRRNVKKSGMGKKSKRHVKRSSMHKKKAVRHNRKMKMWGGANWIKGENRSKLSLVWNSLFYERAKDLLAGRFVETLPSSGKVLFVIDMQKDFIDRPYTRTKDDVHPIYKNKTSIGNFDVADGVKMLMNPTDDAGQTWAKELRAAATDPTAVANFINNPQQTSTFLKDLWTALNDENSGYAFVVFSRDFHPVGHNSFEKKYFFEANLCGPAIFDESVADYRTSSNPENGNFPAHCVQGFEGSLFVPEIEAIIETAIYKDRVKIVFKGMDKGVDSFSAVPMEKIDHNASNSSGGCKCTDSCSSITGGFTLAGVDPVKYNTALDGDNQPVPLQETYNFIDGSVTSIEVCGLAGDYCVRDTIVALSKKFPDKDIILRADDTRYACLPFFTIQNLAQHNYGQVGDKPKLDNADASFDQFVERAKSQIPDKGIIYYLFQLNPPTRTLLEASDLGSLTTKQLNTFADVTGLNGAAYQHFITPHEAIIEDYLSGDRIKIYMTDMLDKKDILQDREDIEATEFAKANFGGYRR
jgi:nicotinamidase-related amidase